MTPPQSVLLGLMACVCSSLPWLPAEAASIQSALFYRCPDGQTHNGTALSTVWEGSSLTCAASCVMNDECNSLNVCPSVQDGVVKGFQCTMFLDVTAEVDCTDLIATTVSLAQECFYLERNERRCQNGGSRYGNKCLCERGFAGELCERFIQDCQEAVEYAATRPQDGILALQPMGSPRTCHVICEFQYNQTVVLQRVPECVSFSRGWAEYQTGFGLLNDRYCPGVTEFFSGLDCLAYITSQATYQLHALYEYDQYTRTASAFYNAFRIGNEAGSYALTYDSFYTKVEFDSCNGFATGTVLFHTLDHDSPASCAAMRGQPGWYGANCEGYSPFGTSLTWPVPAGNVTVNKIKYYLMRQ